MTGRMTDHGNSKKATCIHQLFEVQAARVPHDPCIFFENRMLTWSELDDQAGRLARHLVLHGVGKGTVVGLYLEQRSEKYLIGLLAILKAGAAFLPLDPTLPERRLTTMFEHAGISCIVCSLQDRPMEFGGVQKVHLERCQEEVTSVCLPQTEPGDLAYIIFTSGSTGQPKGVMVEHAGVVNFIQNLIRHYGITSEDRCLQSASFYFDFFAI